MYSGEGKAEEENHEILHHCISDWRLAFHFNISRTKKYCDKCAHALLEAINKLWEMETFQMLKYHSALHGPTEAGKSINEMPTFLRLNVI
jgi:hypothetical protein